MTPRPRRRDSLWIALGLAAVAGLLAATQATWRVDRLVYDRALSWWTQPTPPQITLIAIDDASLEAIGRWPWRRAVHATLLQHLAQVRPRAIALDLVLSEPDPDPREDALLAAALQRAAPVLLPVPWVAVGGSSPRWLDPAPLLAGVARLASADAALDEDGVLRSTFLQVGPAGAPRPHVALAMLQAAGEGLHPAVRVRLQPPAADPLHWHRDGRLLIRYGGPPGHVDHVSYVDVLRGAVPAARLQGRYLLVGMTAQGLGDTQATPVNRDSRAMPGVEVLAQTLHMLRSGDTLQALPPAPLAALSALIVFGGVVVMARLGQRGALLVGLGGAVALLLASVAAVGAGWWLAPAPAVAAALLAYPLWSWRRLELAVSGLDAELRLLGAGAKTDTGDASDASDATDAIDARLQRLRAAAELLRQARRYLADMLESLPTAMLVADAQHRVVMANAGAAALFEVEDAEELRGLDLLRQLQEFKCDEPPDWRATLAALHAGGAQPAFQVRLPGHGDHVVQLTAAELAGSRCVLVSVADVAPVKRAERQREEALAFVSHDLRSPASAIVLLTDSALAGSSRAEDWLPQVRRLAQRSLEMSEAFVRYAQAELVAPELTPTLLRDVVDDASASLAPQAASQGLVLVCQVQPDDAVFTLDRALVARALANLLSNALHHSPPAGTVRLRAWLDASAAVFEVADEGPGLAAVQQQALAQADGGLRSGHAAGVGLGLRFVQRVARIHGGVLRWREAAGAQPGRFELCLGGGGSGNP